MSYGKKLTEFVSFLVLIEIFYYYNTYATVGGFGVGYQYIGCILLVLIGVGVFLVSPDLSYLYHVGKAAGVLSVSYFVVMIYSAGIWIFTFTPIRQIISGFFEPSYMILCTVCVAMMAYVFRDKMIRYSFWALTIAFLFHVFPIVANYGLPGFVHRLFLYVSSGGMDGMGVSLEATNYSYAFAFFFIYFFAHRREEPIWKCLFRLFIIVFGLLDTFKRSSIIALAVSFVVMLMYIRFQGRYRELLLNLIIAVVCLFAFFYIPFIRYNLFERIVNALNINTSSRTAIYKYYQRYYEFSLSYLGKGFGWLHRLSVLNTGFASIGVHCDYVRFYIELGFWGYLFWIFSVFPLVIKKITKGLSDIDGAVVIGANIAMMVLRITENISFGYLAILTMTIIIIQSVVNNQDI